MLLLIMLRHWHSVETMEAMHADIVGAYEASDVSAFRVSFGKYYEEAGRAYGTLPSTMLRYRLNPNDPWTELPKGTDTVERCTCFLKVALSIFKHFSTLTEQSTFFSQNLTSN